MALFLWPVRVYYEDTDAAGVVYYANYLKFMERARSEWLRSLGFEQDHLMRDPGIAFVVRSASVKFHRPARFNDGLMVDVGITRIGRASLDIAHRVTRGEGDRELLCSAQVSIACLDHRTFKPRAIPQFIVTGITHEH